jgi:hypothetical protein
VKKIHGGWDEKSGPDLTGPAKLGEAILNAEYTKIIIYQEK